MKVWFITDEGKSITEEGGLSLVGVFSTKEKALAYLKDNVLGEEAFKDIIWRQADYNKEYFEGLDINSRYILSTTEVDSP